MKRVVTGVLASLLALCATAAIAQTKSSLKPGGILDMSGLYADITGPGSIRLSNEACAIAPPAGEELTGKWRRTTTTNE